MRKGYSWQTEILGRVSAMNIGVFGKVRCFVFILVCLYLSVIISGGLPPVYAQESSMEEVESCIYVVSQDGTGDFSTISEAVEQVSSGDTIVVYPGIYQEAVRVDEKTLTLEGIDRDSCIIQWDTTSYESVPLNIGAGTIKNLTIYGTSQEIQSHETKEIPELGDVTQAVSEEWNRHFSGYAVHIDQEYSYGKDLLFWNCKIISEHNYCVGIGCKGESTVTFEQCEMISIGKGGCLYMHDTLGQDGGISMVQLKNCNLKNYLPPYLITIGSFRDTNEVYLTFQNVHVSTVAYSSTDVYDQNNLNNGVPVPVLHELDQSGLLYEMGYFSTIPYRLVNILSLEESASYIDRITKEPYLLHEEPYLPEGISLLDMPAATNRGVFPAFAYNNGENENAKCMIIRILNESGQTGDAWCGSSNFYLTEDSYGNTLIEMNAPLQGDSSND